MKRRILGTIMLFLGVGAGVAGPGHSSNLALAQDWPLPAGTAAAGEEEAPMITLEPGPQVVLAGGTATFTAAASGTPAPALQWQRSIDRGTNWSNLAEGGVYSGTTSETLQLSRVTLLMSGELFRLTATNSLGGAMSRPVALLTETLIAGGGYNWVVQAGSGTERVGKIATDPAGSLCVVGSFSDPLKIGETTLVPQGAEDIFVFKFSGTGTLLWAKAFGGRGQDEGLGVAVDSRGSILVAGGFSEIVTIGTNRLASRGGRNVVVFKLDGNGNPLWAARAGGESAAVAKSIAVDAAGSVLVAGEYYARHADFGATVFDNLRDAPDLFVTKLTSTGDFVWAVTVGGRDSTETLRSIQVDGAGNAYITGTFDQGLQLDEGADVKFGSDILVSAGLDDAFLAKLNGGGAFVWSRQIGTEYIERVLATATDAGGTTLMLLSTEGTDFVIDGQSTTKSQGFAQFDSTGKLIALQDQPQEKATIADLARGNGDNWLFAGGYAKVDDPAPNVLAGRMFFPGVNVDNAVAGGPGSNLAVAAAAVQGGLYLAGTVEGRVGFGQPAGFAEGPCLFFARFSYPPAGAGPPVLRFVSAGFSGQTFRMVLVNRVGAPLAPEDLTLMEVHTSSDLVTWRKFTGKSSLISGQLVLEDTPGAGITSRYYRVVAPDRFQTVP